MLPWVLVRLAHYKGIDGKFRLFRYSHWIPAQWREFHELYEFARMRGWQREQLVLRRGAFSQAGRVVRAGVPEDAAADASRLRQLHAGPGRVGRAAARGLGAVAVADAAARVRGATFYVDLTGTQGLRRRDRPHTGGRVLFLDASPGTTRDRRADALAARAGRRVAEAGRTAGARAAAAADAARVAVRPRCDRARAARAARIRPKATCASWSDCRR